MSTVSQQHAYIDSHENKSRRWLWRSAAFCCGGLLWIGLPVYGWIAHGWQALEKTLTALAMPIGLIWSLLLLVGLIGVYRGEKWQAVSSLGVALLLGLLGNSWIASQMNSVLERPISHLIDDDRRRSYDAVILLGGSTRMSASGKPQLNWDGQRLVLAAQLYHAGRTDRIIATGGNPVFTEDELAHSEQAQQLLQSLGVPGDAIECLAGRNTREEMADLSRRIGPQAEDDLGRIGLITSAGHMPRALRLAEKAGLSVEPIPCIFHGAESRDGGFGPLTVIPSAHGIVMSTTACYELLARIAGQ